MSERSDLQMKAMMEMPEQVEIGGRKFKIYPPSRGKIEVISGVIAAFGKVIDGFGQIKEGQGGGFMKLFNSSLAEICHAAVVLTKPNTGKPPEEDPELEEFFKWALDPAGAMEIAAHLMRYASIDELLKNVPRAMLATMTSFAGPSSSPSPSSSPAGPSNTSSGESALEV